VRPTLAPYSHQVALGLVLACTWVGCTTASATGAAAAGPTTVIKDGDAPEPAHDARADAEQAPDTAPACVVRQAARTFVGLPDLNNFEVTAREAERVLQMAKLELCQLDAAQDKDGTLRAALSGGVVEIMAVRFDGDELSRAVLEVQTVPVDGSKPSALETHWRVHAERVADEWQVASTMRESSRRQTSTGKKKPKRH
jgi:hypothetical protein